MFLLSYKYQDYPEGWNISECTFTKNNLFVGASGAGKSRMLNTLWNVGNFISTNAFRDGAWEIKFKIKEDIYKWSLLSSRKDKQEIIIEEKLLRTLANGQEEVILNRENDSFFFRETKLPKLPKNSTGLYLLKEENDVKGVYEGFGRIARRNFFGNDLLEACAISNVPPELLDKAEYKKRKEIWGILPISPRLYLLHLHDKEKFDRIVEEYKSIFNTVEDIIFVDALTLVGRPVHHILALKEKGISSPIMLHDLSSGMQKVLFIILDIITLPNDFIYIIDEYENSLGINAINFLPDFINSYGQEAQFITTSHHPYLINNIPISDWKIFSRSGSNVSIRNGTDLVGKYSKSKQDAFIQLLNDPIFSGE